MELTIAKKIAACLFYRDPLRAKIIFNTSYEKFDLSTHVLADNTFFSLILMPYNIDFVTVFEWEVFILSDDCVYIFGLLLFLSIL